MQAAERTHEIDDQQAEKRDKKGRALAAMGHVTRTDDGFDVASAGRKRDVSRVFRDIDGRVRCSCREFAEAEDGRFRCEHILAVKYYLEPPFDDVAPHPEAKEPAEGAEPIQMHALIPEGEAPRRDFGQVLVELKHPLPDNLVKQRIGWTDREGRVHEVDYVEWHVVADILDRVAPRWSHRVRNIVQVGGLVAVTASITIDGVTREGIGTGEAIDEKGIKKAEHDALKRAAVKFGIARELYRKDLDFESHEGHSDDPVARSLTDLITPKQLVAIRAIATASGLDAEKRAIDRFGCRPEELTKKAASQLIDELKVARSDGQPSRRAS